MRKLVLIFIPMLSFLTASPQPDIKWQQYSIAPSAKDSFLFYKKQVNKKDLEAEKEYMDLPAVIIPYQLGDSVFANPPKEAGILECQCAFDKDTLIVAIGFGFYGGAFFIAKANKNVAGSFFTAWSEEADFRTGSANEWQKEIELTADKFEFALSKKTPFLIGETIYGIWKADYPAYQQKEDGEVRNMKNKLKIYFSCKVDYEIQ